jgi:hypothetical protein
VQFHFLELKSPKFVGLKFCPEKVSVKNSKTEDKNHRGKIKRIAQSSWNKKTQGSVLKV